MKLNNVLFLSFITLVSVSFGQEDTVKKTTQELNGYVKYLSTTTNQPLYDAVLTDNLIHNRLNYQAEYKSKYRFNISARNRLY
jgi:hypothetical protein